jgi:hypothetical protein
MSGCKGNGGKRQGAGRKSKAEELGLQKLLDKCWTQAERRACIKKLAQDAKSKDFKERSESRKLLLAYAFGKPKERHDVNLDGFDWDSADLEPLNPYELERIIAGDDPRAVFAAARARRIREEAKAIEGK